MSFRHRGWQPRRLKTREALRDLGKSSAVIDRFDQCGADAWVLRTRTAPVRYKVAADYCRNRWCMPCARARGALIAANLHDRMHGRRCKFVTLTIRHSDQPLKEQIDRLYKCFAALRRRKIWADHVHGGAAVLEVHHTGGRNGWHPHLHVLVEAAFVDRRELSATWHSLTRDSFVVDVRQVHNDVHAVRYVTKYLSKPLGSTVVDRRGHLVEAMQAMEGRKLVMTFGTWRDIELTKAPDDDTPWEFVAGLAELLDQASRGDATARRIMQSVEAATGASRGPPPPGFIAPGDVPADMFEFIYA